jgi:hypothetical protein
MLVDVFSTRGVFVYFCAFAPNGCRRVLGATSGHLSQLHGLRLLPNSRVRALFFSISPFFLFSFLFSLPVDLSLSLSLSLSHLALLCRRALRLLLSTVHLSFLSLCSFLFTLWSLSILHVARSSPLRSWLPPYRQPHTTRTTQPPHHPITLTYIASQHTQKNLTTHTKETSPLRDS